jgi:hypothetical protein
MFAIQFMDPYLFWIGVPLVLLAGIALAWYSTKSIEGARKFYGDLALLDLFTPRSAKQTRSLWAQWILFFAILIAAAAGPNATDTPELAQAGALQVQVVIDVSPSMGAEDYRPFIKPALGQTVPTAMYQWGTRIDMAKQIIKNDLLPQLKDNEVGLVTVEGSGYNMWDLTRDHKALSYMLDNFVQVGAAPGGGADYVSGIQTALDGFKLSGETGKERFIVLISDGGFTGDPAAMDKLLQELKKQNVHLLIIGFGGNTPITVPKYDSSTKQRNGAYEGTTAYEPEFLRKMVAAVPGATLLTVPPGTEHISSYNFPEHAGGLYAKPKKSNLYFWFLCFDMLLLLSITFGGGELPSLKTARAICLEPVSWVQGIYRRFKN